MTSRCRTVAAAALSTAVLLLLAACAPTATTSTAAGPTPVGTGAGTAAPTAVASTVGTSAPVKVAGYPSGRQTISLDVDGTKRTAVLVVPADLSKPAPLIFGFHGHGGSGAQFEKSENIDGLWPEAIFVYPDGLVGHKGITDPEGVKPGWQTVPGEDGDRDLHFYDALFADLQAKLPIDNDRIYVMGHSNGSAFTSMLLNVRGDKIAATDNMSAQPGGFLKTDPVRSMFMSMGKTDPIVPYDNQVKSIPLAEEHLAVDPATAKTDGYLKTETGTGNHELDTYVHPAGHEVPAEVPPLVIAFFKRHTLSGG